MEIYWLRLFVGIEILEHEFFFLFFNCSYCVKVLLPSIILRYNDKEKDPLK